VIQTNGATAHTAHKLPLKSSERLSCST